MKKILLAILFTLLIMASFNAQTLTTIGGRCPSPNQNSFGQINFFGSPNGDLDVRPCTTGATIFHGAVNFTDATIVLPGFVTGSGTTNFIPRWTNGAGSVIGNTPFSWDNTIYKWQNTALNNNFVMEFTPSSTVGLFTVGRGADALIIDQGGSVSSLSGTDEVDINGGSGTIGVTSGGIVLNSGTGIITAGDVNGIGTGTLFTLDDNAHSVTLNTPAGVKLPQQSPSAILTLNGSGVITSNLMTNGQIPIGSTGANPVIAALTAGTGISVTNGAGSITIASTGASSLNSYLAADFTNATTTLNNTLLSVPLAASTKYGCTAQLFVSDSLAADGVKVDFGGGSATFTNFIAGSNSVLVTSVTNSSTSTFSNATVTGANLITITASIEANGAGTFIIRAAQVAHTIGTLTVSRGSRLICTQMS